MATVTAGSDNGSLVELYYGDRAARFLASHGSGRVSKAAMVGAIPPFLLGGVPGRVFYHMKKSLTEDRDVFITAFLNDAYDFDVLAGIRITEREWQAGRVIAARAFDYVTSACIGAGLTDFRADIPPIGVPTLVVHGTADRILPIDARARLLPDLNTNVSVVEVDGAPTGSPGHIRPKSTRRSSRSWKANQEVKHQ